MIQRRIPTAVAVQMRKFRPLQEPIRLQDLNNSARSRAEKKIKSHIPFFLLFLFYFYFIFYLFFIFFFFRDNLPGHGYLENLFKMISVRQLSTESHRNKLFPR